MAMGKRQKQRQGQIWLEVKALSKGSSHPFNERLNEVLERHGFDAFVEGLAAKFYAPRLGRPSLPPSVYFRLLLIGYFEGIDSERGIAWRVADSLTLREFLGLELTDVPPDQSTISRNRRLLDLEAHQEAFTWVLVVLAREGVLSGKTLGIDATTLEANAALRSIVRLGNGLEHLDQPPFYPYSGLHAIPPGVQGHDSLRSIFSTRAPTRPASLPAKRASLSSAGSRPQSSAERRMTWSK